MVLRYVLNKINKLNYYFEKQKVSHTKLIHEGTGKLVQTEDLSLFYGLSACAATLPEVMIQSYFVKFACVNSTLISTSCVYIQSADRQEELTLPFNMCFDSISAVDQLDECRYFFSTIAQSDILVVRKSHTGLYFENMTFKIP